MAFLTIAEFIDIIIMVLGVGFIFKDVFQRNIVINPEKEYDPLAQYNEDGIKLNLRKKTERLVDSPFFIACLATAPAVIFHELAHKFTAIALGVDATFHASYFWLAIGVALKLMNFGFIFFVPGYVTHAAGINPGVDSMIAFAGPFLNLILWLGSLLILKTIKVKGKWFIVLQYTKSINMFLFFFNMIPLPPFDGAAVFQGLFKVLFG